MKFLHTSDWQIGMKAIHVGQSGEVVREKRIESLKTVMKVAVQEAVEFVVVTGDLFEDNGVDRLLVQRVVDILIKPRLPVFVIPGNHDPYIPGSVWEHPSWKLAQDVHILARPEPIHISGGYLYPCPVFEKHSLKDPTSWIKTDDSSAIHIGLAHGTVEGVDVDLDFPIPRDAPAQRGLDYLALGHFHSYAFYKDNEQAIRMAYSGTHETTKFGERDSGNVLIVEILGPGVFPKITPVPTGALQWRSIEKEIRELGDIIELQKQVDAMEASEFTLLSLFLKGILMEQGTERIHHLSQVLSSRFLYSRLDQTQLHLLPQDDMWTSVLPPGHIRLAGEQLREWSDPLFTGSRPEGITPTLASQALLELYALSKEIGR